MKGSRNAPCPCGSGRKYKRCCLAAAQATVAESRRDDAVGRRISAWSTKELRDEMALALEEFGSTRPLSDPDLHLFNTWFHNDRQLADGATPALAYSRRDDIDDVERAVAARIAAARLGIHQVTGVEPGSGIELVDQLSGARTRVASWNVSREVVRWDFLLARVMDGEPESLWGPARPFSAAEGEELLAELGRLARACGEREDQAGLERALRRSALELFRFRPPSAIAERSFYTLEGDPVAEARASWELVQPLAARVQLARAGGIEEDEASEELSIDITAPRSALLAERDGELPLGATVIEQGAGIEGEHEVVATVSCEGASLIVEAMSEQRLIRAIATVEGSFRDLLAGAPAVRIVSIEERLAEGGREAPAAHASPEGLTAADERRILGDFFAARYRGWLDEPNPALGGSTPREVARDGRRDKVVRLARRVENGAARSAREGGIGREVDLLGELGMDGEAEAA